MRHDSRDFTPAASNWLVRAYYTPVSDALRGHLSARLDVRREIAAAGLPAPLADVISTVVRRTRLWRIEKLDVAGELIAHFADGIAAGRAAEELAKDFGSPQQAARLIRKAKRRNRPLWWQTCRIALRLFLVVFAVSFVSYSVLAARFYLGRPQIAHNYWHEINAARQVPEADRAWPLYREAAIKLGKTKIEPEWFDAGPMGKHWNQLLAALEQHPEMIDLCHQAAKKPHLGFYWGDPGDLEPEGFVLPDTLLDNGSPLADDNKPMSTFRLEPMSSFRKLAWLLRADAQRAALAGDGATVMADLTTSLSISEQIFQPKSDLVEQLCGFAVFNHTLEGAGQILADSPAVLTDEQLRELAHRIAAYRNGAIQIDLSTAQMWFDDLLQRFYTDDGHGNGRLTPAGLEALENQYLIGGGWDLFEKIPRPAGITDKLLTPGFAALIANRQETSRYCQSLMDEGIRLHQGSPWTWDAQAINAQDDRLRQVEQHPMQRICYLYVVFMLPALSSVFDVPEQSIQCRDAAEVAIGLVLWHRRHGDWPTSLDQLTPDLLPAVPPDRFDGQPLRYVVRDGQPVVYSIGADHDDDDGRPAADPDQATHGFYGQFDPKDTEHFQLPNNDGDWILWPPLKKEEKEEAGD